VTPVLVVSHHADIVGGGELSLLGLLEGLDRARWTPTLVVPADGPLAARARALGVPTQVVPMPTPRHPGPAVLRSLLALRALAREARLVHANGVRAMCYAGLAGRLVPRPVVWHVRVADRDPVLDRLLVRLASAVVVNSRAVGRRFGTPAPRKVRCIYNGVDLARFAPRPPSPALRAALGLPPEAPVVVSVGRFVAFKGYGHLLDAAAAVQARRPGVRWLLVGDGPLRGELEARCRSLGLASLVTFAGWREDVPDLLALGDLFVLPSLAEHFGRVLIEAMALGKPVVATAAGGVPEVVADGETGLLVPPADPEALAGAVEALLADRERAARLGVAARRRAETAFSQAGHAEAMAALFRELTGADPRTRGGPAPSEGASTAPSESSPRRDGRGTAAAWSSQARGAAGSTNPREPVAGGAGGERHEALSPQVGGSGRPTRSGAAQGGARSARRPPRTGVAGWLTPRSRVRTVLVLVLALAAVRYGHAVLKLALTAPFIDFANFYVYTATVAAGLDPFDPAQLARMDAELRIPHAIVPPTYGPAGHLLLLPFTALPFWLASLLWLGLGQGCLVAALGLWWRRLRPDPVLAFAGLVVVLGFQPILEEIAIGNLNLPALPLLALAGLGVAAGRPLLAAAPLSWAVHLKPQYALLVPFLVWLGAGRAAGLALALAAAWAVLAVLVFGHTWVGGYLAFLLVGSADLHAWLKNLSPHAMLHRLLSHPAPHPLVDATAVLLAAAITLAVLWATRRARSGEPETRLTAWALGLAAVPLVSPLTEEVHLVALLLPLLLALWRLPRRSGPGEVGLLLGAAVLLASRYSLEAFPLFASGVPSLAHGGKALGAAALAVVLARSLSRATADREAGEHRDPLARACAPHGGAGSAVEAWEAAAGAREDRPNSCLERPVP
jgi:glycosyltransferase involved in cell wall biosynthesis